jgi:glycosyltransferase involved in cell wall biosynthesis
MHNLTKIKTFRILLWITYPLAIVACFPIALLKKRKPSGLFFFFDRYSIGGAQRVYLDILEAVHGTQKTVYFTRKSSDTGLKIEFYSRPNTDCRDIHRWTENLLLRIFTVHYYAFFVNRHSNVRILGSNSTFFYDMLPYLKPGCKRMELFHNFAFNKNGMEFFGLANYRYLDVRLLVDGITKQNIEQQYKQYRIPDRYSEKLRVVEYGVELPSYPQKSATPPLKILYAGRGSSQKRIWLLNRIVEYFITRTDVQFTFAGSMRNELSDNVRTHCIVYDEVGDREVMNALFRNTHAIILTSAFEGFPVVVKEGMANGCIPIVTALPGNKLHLEHLVNSLLIEEPENEENVVKNAIDNIETLLSDSALLQLLSRNAHSYAMKNFGKHAFLKAYRELLNN